MKALCWHADADVRLQIVPDPELVGPRDAIVHVSLSAIADSDLPLYRGRVPTLAQGDVIGHEFCGEVVAVGRHVARLAPGDRVAVPSVIACGACFHCRQGRWSLCDASNPNAHLAARRFGYAAAGMFGYSRLFGGYAGGDAEYVRVPFADVGPRKIPDGVSDEQALLTCDVLPRGASAADRCELGPGDTLAVWGAGPIGHGAILRARERGVERVIAIDPLASRRELARHYLDAEALDGGRADVVEALRELTAGRGPDACIDAASCEAGAGGEGWCQRARRRWPWRGAALPAALEQAILACRKGGVVVIAGGVLPAHVEPERSERAPLGAALSKGLTLHMGRSEGHAYMAPLLEAIAAGRFDPSYLLTHRFPLARARDGFRLLEAGADDCLKVSLTPS
jgi:threonine dehydrogenase-like Zn-dependent dehydrogenase